MCGIAGFYDTHRVLDAGARAAVVGRMCDVIKHRGPDDQGMIITPEGVALGMRRLSIIDLAGGHQPISNEDGTINVVFNGEIYNYRELQRELETRGHQFRTNSDTEVIVHAFEEYDTACVERFRGMFAFALWDSREKRLFLARDRVGKKPLYYTLTPDGTLVFGSELKSLLNHPKVRCELNLEALDAFFTYGYVPDPLSILDNVQKLAPGHHLTFANGRLSLQKYWDFRYEHTSDNGLLRADDYLEELRGRLDEAVRVRLVADVPLGAFLSGGIDSSTVVGLMSRHTAQPVKTFSIGFNEDSYNELKYARVAAKHFGTEHHEFIVTPDICQVVDELSWYLDEPFADSSAIPTYLVSKMAREHVKVVLSGDGGDELFAGYTRYVVDRRRNRFADVPRLLRHGVVQRLSRSLPHGALGRNFLYNITLNALDRYIDSVSVFTSLTKPALYSEDFKRRLRDSNGHDEFAAMARFRWLASRVSTGEPLDSLLYLDSKTYLPGDILTKVDRMSMAVSLEARAPLLDHELIDFVTTIPARLKLSGLETKHIFKRAVCDLVPSEILNRSKQGFGVPIQEWINEQLRGRICETLLEPRTLQRGYLDPGYIRLLLAEHERQRRDHSSRLWALFMLELWHRNFYDSAAAPPAVEEEAPITVAS